MTYKEAHKILEEQQRTLTGHYGVRSNDEKLIEANGVAILAVEKQIPKNAIVEKRAGDNVYCCPACGKSASDFRASYCQQCGQAIIWGETD